MSPNAQIFYMTKLKAGDKRRKGDIFVRKIQHEFANHEQYTERRLPGVEYPVNLVGLPILPSDLIADDFFRPENFLVK